MPASIFNGTAVKLLKNILRFKDGTDLSSAQVSYLNTITSDVQAQLDSKIDESREAQANGIATLDGGGKVPAAQLPNSIMDYLGNWAASTNTPTLANGVGNNGDVYQATDSGTVNFGAGGITFAAGDFVIYNGTIWQKSLNSNAVVSVNGLTGIVVLSTTNISEGSNLYYTTERAQDDVGILFTATSTVVPQYNDTAPSMSWDIGNNSILNIHISSSAAIAYSKLNLAGSIVNNDIASGAAIAVNKLAALTTGRALVSDGSGFVSAAATTATEIGYVNGVTSAIQTQLNGKIGYNLLAVSTNTSAAAGATYLVTTSGGAVQITLPTPALNTFVTVKDNGAAETNALTVVSTSGELIDGAASDVITSNYGSATYLASASAWYRI